MINHNLEWFLLHKVSGRSWFGVRVLAGTRPTSAANSDLFSSSYLQKYTRALRHGLQLVHVSKGRWHVQWTSCFSNEKCLRFIVMCTEWRSNNTLFLYLMLIYVPLIIGCDPLTLPCLSWWPSGSLCSSNVVNKWIKGVFFSMLTVLHHTFKICLCLVFM